MKPKRKLQGSVDRGKLQSAKAGNAASVLTDRFKPGSDASPNRHPNVSGYSPKFQKAAGSIDALLRKKGR